MNNRITIGVTEHIDIGLDIFFRQLNQHNCTIRHENKKYVVKAKNISRQAFSLNSPPAQHYDVIYDKTSNVCDFWLGKVQHLALHGCRESNFSATSLAFSKAQNYAFLSTLINSPDFVPKSLFIPGFAANKSEHLEEVLWKAKQQIRIKHTHYNAEVQQMQPDEAAINAEFDHIKPLIESKYKNIAQFERSCETDIRKIIKDEFNNRFPLRFKHPKGYAGLNQHIVNNAREAQAIYQAYPGTPLILQESVSEFDASIRLLAIGPLFFMLPNISYSEYSYEHVMRDTAVNKALIERAIHYLHNFNINIGWSLNSMEFLVKGNQLIPIDAYNTRADISMISRLAHLPAILSAIICWHAFLGLHNKHTKYGDQLNQTALTEIYGSDQLKHFYDTNIEPISSSVKQVFAECLDLILDKSFENACLTVSEETIIQTKRKTKENILNQDLIKIMKSETFNIF